ncbi:MAG: long-chain fatty acid--CoA ligase [Polyangiales bacterium]
MNDFRPTFRTVTDIYRRSMASYANCPLFGVKRGTAFEWSTYGAFGEQVERFRGGLASLGVQRGDRVAVIANNRPEWAVGAYATYTLGAAYVPMYEAQHSKEWAYILRDSGSKAVLVGNQGIADALLTHKAETPELEHIIVLGAAKAPALSFDEVLKRGASNPAPLVDSEPEDVCNYIYTSGTTGNPKGVLLTHSNIASNVSAIHAVFPIERDDRSLSFLPWAHSFGQVVELHALFSMGASMGIAEAVEKIVQNLAEVQPTLLFSVPRIFNRIYEAVHKKVEADGGVKKALFEATMANAALRRKLAQEGQTSLVVELKYALLDRLVSSKIRARFGGRLKYAFSGGAAIAKEVAEFVDNLGITVYEGYGLTETSPIATANWPGSRKLGSVGRPIPGVEVTVSSNGELVVHGHNVMKGYHHLPDENAKVFTDDGGFRTGDMGYIDDEGFVFITGRIKEQYKLENGKYVAPVPLEEQLKLSPFITNVMVYGDNKPFNVALVVVDPEAVKQWATSEGVHGGDLEALLKDQKVRALIDTEIAKHSDQFKQFERVKNFALIGEDFTTENDMLTPSLKLKRRVVLDRYGDRLQGLYTKN